MDVFNTASDLKERGFHMYDPPVMLLSYDPAGDGNDNDAIVMTQREEHRRGELHDPDLAMEMIFRVMLCHRFEKGMEFPDKLALMLRLNRQLVAWQRKKMISAGVITVETNGVGYAMASSLRSKVNTNVISYATVARAGEEPSENGKVAMPRLPALDNLRVLMELHRLKMVKDCQGAKLLKQELNSFVWRGPKRPEAMEGENDDLVMALAGGVWIGTKILPPITQQVPIDPKNGIRGHLNRNTTGNMRIQ